MHWLRCVRAGTSRRASGHAPAHTPRPPAAPQSLLPPTDEDEPEPENVAEAVEHAPAAFAGPETAAVKKVMESVPAVLEAAKASGGCKEPYWYFGVYPCTACARWLLCTCGPPAAPLQCKPLRSSWRGRVLGGRRCLASCQT